MALAYATKCFGEGAANQNPGVPAEDKTKEWQMELLMEKLRSKANQFKSFTESAKALRMALLEKRYPCDNVERSQLQKCLDTLQHSIKVTSLQGMVERLESLTRQLGLKFMAGPSGLDWFISSDMFYLEVVLEATGAIKDVKIHHEGKVEIQSCEELVSCLSRGDFTDFTAQLEGLASIYQLNAEKKVKCKAFSALQSLETDLGTLASVQTMIKEPFNLVHKSPVGILEKRRGGHAMKLTYFVSPYDLLDPKTGAAVTLSVEEVVARKLGYSALVCMEGSVAHKLPTSPLITINRATNGKPAPVYVPLSATNSCTLPARLLLKLSEPMPICLALVQKISQLTDMECGDAATPPQPLLGLIAKHASQNTVVDTRKGLFVSLPDQHHCYFMTETKGLDGMLITSIPFGHPSHVPQILVFLRQQALLNTLISSCIRSSAKDLEAMTMFEVSALSWQHLSISFEHPLEETLATAELDLSDIGNVKCTVYGAGMPAGEAVHASKVLQRCMSIPVTMRSLIRSWQTQPGPSASLGNPAVPPGDPSSSQGPADFDLSRVKTEPDRPSYNASDSSEPTFQPPADSSFLMLGAKSVEKKNRKRRATSGESFRSPKRKTSDDCEIVMENSSEDPFPDADAVIAEKPVSDDDANVEMEDLDEKPIRKVKKEKPAILVELENKTLVTPSVSITPIVATPTFNSVLTGMGLERRPGIEIIPISSTPAAALPSSITITAITGKPSGDRDRKGNKPRSDDKARLEKKRKKRREELGIVSGNDGLNKPVSVSIKQTDGKVSLGSSGKPSMSTLKSASSSPGKTDQLKVKTQSSKDKDRKDNAKVKSSSVKLKQVDGGDPACTIPGGAAQPQARNRKGSLSAIVDKLKSAQHCGPEPGEVKPNSTAKTPGEYMVKPSSDGMKITINKTRTKESKSGQKSSSSQGSGSPKTIHSGTGLKPGVNSGPASKKPHTSSIPVKSPSASGSKTSSGSSSSSSSSSKVPPKSSSPVSGILGKSSKSGGSPKMGERRDKRPPKPGEKVPFVKGKSSPVMELEGERAFKLLAAHAKIEPSLVVEGLIKALDTKFQIPKLSARNQDATDSKKTEKTVDQVKPIDLAKSDPVKFPVKSVEEKIVKTSTSPVSISVPTVSKASSPVVINLTTKLEPEVPPPPAPVVVPPVVIAVAEEKPIVVKEEPPKAAEPVKEPAVVPVTKPPEPKVVPAKPEEPRKPLLTTENRVVPKPPGPTTPQEAAEILLDFSATSLKPEPKVTSVPERVLAPQRRNTPPPPLPPPVFPNSPSVTMHIVKSPAPSPLIIPSPHSASPCITDDELMDEALVGMGK